ncbi:alkaline phosphatase-like [Clytia hemisphaerica]
MEKLKMSSTCLVLIFLSLIYSSTASFDDIYGKQQSNQWFKDGVETIKQNLKIKPINRKAKGVILFLGDGMGVSTVTAGRILDGQLKQQPGEENVLSWEMFPNAAFSKTYNTNQQTPDSAGTATAFMTGVKARAGVISVNENVKKANCSDKEGNDVLSLIMIAEQYGLSTGVVSTARLTHATPATAYANSPSRNWESNAEVSDGDCPDIAKQLIDFPYGDGLEIAFGGGRKHFLRTGDPDDDDVSKFGKRTDGHNLKQDWLKTKNHKYVSNRDGLKNLEPNIDNKVLGLFNYDHMDYEYNRNSSKEPSLTEMVEFAITTLQQSPNGFVLLVEAGRIDHGHHASKPVLALHDLVEFNKAVTKAKEIVNQDETLMIVTADHSHVFTLGGYAPRGNPIFAFTGHTAKDKKGFTSLAYTNGPGGKVNATRHEPTDEQLLDANNYRWQSLVPLSSETHGGEDVGIYSQGPQAHLLRGVVEQNVIFHVMDYALCLSESKKSICRTEGLISGRNNSVTLNGGAKWTLMMVSILWSFLAVFS